MKKIIAIVLGFIFCFCNLVPVLAVSSQENSEENKITVYSPSFPDAYIEVEDSKMRSIDNMNSINVTVYVEDTYNYDENNNLVITTSRLLSKEEVLSIGEETFSDSMEYPVMTSNVEVSPRVTRGKLSLYLSTSGLYINADYDYEFEVHADATWESNLWDGSNYPSQGSDFLSLAWSGGYSCYDAGVIIQSARDSNIPYCTLCASEPNALRVWEFPEQWARPIGFDYAEQISLYATLARPMSVVSDGYDEAVLKYIHTYEEFDGSVSIQLGGDDKVTPTINLDNVEKQWSIVCVISKIAP